MRKKCLSVLMVSVLAIAMLAGCGKKNAAEPEVQEVVQDDASAEEEVSEAVEESNVTTPFLEDMEKFESILSTVTTQQYYAFAAVGDDDVLLVANDVYDYGDGTMAAIDAIVYAVADNGEIYQAGNVWSSGTAYPIAVYDNCLMFGGNHEMSMASVMDGSVVIVKEAYEQFDEQGNATYFYNEGDIDNIQEPEDNSILLEMFETYEKATPINFFQGEAEFVPDPEITEDYPSNALEERVGKTSFDSYDEIIGLLQGDEAYALVNIKGYDGQVLLVAENVYDDLLGHMATTECTPYTMKSNGQCTADSMLYSGGTADPVSIDSEGVVYTATHTSIEKNCYGENGTDNASLMVLAYVYADELDDNGDPKTVGGFTRTKNSVVDDDSVFLEGSEVDVYKQLFADYAAKTEPINFTKAAK